MAEGVQGQSRRVVDWRGTLAAADRGNDRHALAALFQNIADHCPNGYFPDEDAAKAETLRKMAAEDDAHPRIADDAFASLSPEEQARELIFQLPDDYTTHLDA